MAAWVMLCLCSIAGLIALVVCVRVQSSQVLERNNFLKLSPELDKEEVKNFIEAFKSKPGQSRSLTGLQMLGRNAQLEWMVKYRAAQEDFTYSIDPDANRDPAQLIKSNGYPVETYTVQTKDGFLLGLYRIPHGRKNSTSKNPRPVVFLQHGFISSSCDWVMNFAENSLGFILADNGYDVWMGNSRGNTYSKKHISLKPDDVKFWDWSFDEMAKYDTPANIDFILAKTGQTSISYIGHSQGTLMAFAMFSQLPEYQKKVRLFIGLAPIMSMNYMKSPLKDLTVFGDDFTYLLLGRKEFLPSDELVKFAVDTVCGNSLTPWVCYDILFLLCGPDLSNLNVSRLEVYLSHTPAGASVKDLVHWSQVIRDKRLAMYDYGSPSENIKHYGQATPPGYNVSKVAVPSVLFGGANDWLADPRDVQILESTLQNVKSVYNFPEWNHLDFVWGKDAHVVCYDKILLWLSKS